MRKIALSLALGAVVAGCAQFDRTIGKIDAAFKKYAPIIGRDIIMVADIIVQAECSPALVPASQATTNILKIIAPDKPKANKVANLLQDNQNVAAQLCPFVSSIKASVGSVPNLPPSQVVAVQ